MEKLSLKAIAEHVGGSIVRGSGTTEIQDVSFGCRARPGELIFDLHHGKFADQMQCPEKDKFAVVTDKPDEFIRAGTDGAIVAVSNVSRACWDFVDYYRSLFSIPMIGVTGTCGKTTTKEMISHILSARYRVNSTYKSYNAQFRHLQYLLDIDSKTQAGVFEMGVAAPGDLLVACRFFKPQVGVITNIGVDHLQEFESIDDYIRAKGDFVEGLGYQGTLVLNGDDANIKKIVLTRFRGKVVTFGTRAGCDFRISGIQTDGRSTKFSLQDNDTTYHFMIPVAGDFNAFNAAAAIAAAQAVGIEPQEAGGLLKTFHNVEKHFEVKNGIHGSTVIDDTWSTNPTSTLAALKQLKSIAHGKKTIAALGKMSLLGGRSDFYHYKTGKSVADAGIDSLVVLGDEAERIGFGAIQGGMPRKNVFFCRNTDDAIRTLESLLDGNTVALVKTSMLASFTDLMNSITEQA